MDLLSLAQRRISGLKKKTAKEWAGPCPECGGSDRFLIWVHKDAWYCRHCDVSGDAVGFLRRFEGMKCHEAHAYLGQACDSAHCPAADNCPGSDRRVGRKPRSLQAPQPAPAAPEFTPAEALPPAERWRVQAEKLIERAHADLLADSEQLAYLAGRGLPREAVERYRLGWLGQDLYRPRAAWGLSEEISRATGKPKKLWLPMGVVIPFFDAAGAPFRIRIRRPVIQEGECRYYWVPGSGDDVPVINPAARAFVVVESDLDGFLVAWHAGDLAGAIPLGTCSAKPKEAATAALRRALAILVSLDHEPRENEKTGRHENPGGKSSQWWLQQFPRAKRWPTPAGKDPGDYLKDHGGNIREWILSGLPPVFHVASRPVEIDTRQQQAATVVASAPAPAVQPAPVAEPVHGVHMAADGREIPYIIVSTVGQHRKMIEQHPGVAVVGRAELGKIDPEATDAVLMVKSVFQGCRVLHTEMVAPAMGR